MTASNPDVHFWVRLRLGKPGDYLEWTVAYTDTVNPSDTTQVLDGLRLGWSMPSGEPLPAHPAVATASFGLYATNGPEVAPYATVGNAVEISLYDGDPDTTGVRWLTWAGRVGNSTAAPRKRPSGPVTLFTISCVDYTVDLAEFTFEFGARPSESLGVRAQALGDAITAAGGPVCAFTASGGDLVATTVANVNALDAIKDLLRQAAPSSAIRYRYYVQPTTVLGSMAPARFVVKAYRDEVPGANLPGILAYRDNLISNTFETNLTGWAATDGAAIAHVTTPVSSGLGAARVTGAAGLAGIASAPGSLIPVTAGTSYTARAKVRANTTPRNCSVSILYYSAALGLLSTTTSAAVASVTTGYKEATVTAVAPANAVWAQVWCRAVSAAGDIQFWDDPVFTEGVPVLELELPGTVNGNLSENVVDGCQVDLPATTWSSRKRQNATRVSVTTAFGTRVKQHLVTPPVALDMQAEFDNTGFGAAFWADRLAVQYLPDLETSETWEVSRFVAYAGPLVDGLGQAGGRLKGWFPDPIDGALTPDFLEPVWPVPPVVVTEVPDSLNLAGDSGLYAGSFTSVELVIQRRKFVVEFAVRRALPKPKSGDADTLTIDWVEAVFPSVDFDHVDALLTMYDSRLARRY